MTVHKDLKVYIHICNDSVVYINLLGIVMTQIRKKISSWKKSNYVNCLNKNEMDDGLYEDDWRNQFAGYYQMKLK